MAEVKSYVRLWPLAFAAIGVAGFIYAGLQWFGHEAAPVDDEAPERPVVDAGADEHFEVVRTHLVDEFGTYRGQVRAGSPINLRAPQGMRVPIVKIHHETGEFVKKGDVLISFHRPQIEDAIVKAKEKGDTTSADRFRGYLEFAELKAPCDGVVDQIYRSIGDVPIDMNSDGQGVPLMTLQDKDSFQFLVQVPGDVQRLSMPLGATFTVELDEDLGSVKGTVAEYGAPVATDVPVILSLAAHEGIQDPLAGTVRVASGKKEVGLIPRSAVERRGDVPFVRAYDAASRSITEKSVRLGAEVGPDVVVLAGVHPGDSVIAPGRKSAQ